MGGIERRRENWLLRLRVVGPDAQDGHAFACAFGPAVRAGRQLLDEMPVTVGGGKLLPLLRRPRDRHGIGPERHGGAARHGAERVVEGDFRVELAEERQVDADEPPRIL